MSRLSRLGLTSRSPGITSFAYINVKDYGAVGDGIHDDTGAIQAALDLNYGGGSNYHRTVIYFPRGTYRITAPLNICDRNDIVIQGTTWLRGSVILGENTGTAMMEIIGSESIQIRNMVFSGSAAHTPTMAIWTGRSVAHPASDLLQFENCYITGYFSQCCYYNVSSESNTLDHIFMFPNGGGMIADVYAGAANGLGLVPVYTTLHPVAFGIYGLFVSHSHLTMAGTVTASAIILNGAQGCTFDNTYLCSYGGAGGRPTIEFVESGGGNVFRTISIEGGVDDAVHFTHGIGSIFINNFFEYCGFGNPANYAIHAENNTEIRQLRLTGCYSNENVLLYDVFTSDLSGLRHYDAIVTNITVHDLIHSTILLELGDTLTITGASIGNLIVDRANIMGEAFCLDTMPLQLGIGAAKVSTIKTGTAIWNPGILLPGASTYSGVAIAGVEQDGTWVTMASLSTLPPIAKPYWGITSYPVSGAVYVVITNLSPTDTIDLDSGTLRVVAIKVA